MTGQSPAAKAAQRARQRTPEYKAKRRARVNTPAYRARKNAKRRTPTYRAKRRAYQRTASYKAGRYPWFNAQRRAQRAQLRALVERHGGERELRRFGEAFAGAVRDLLDMRPPTPLPRHKGRPRKPPSPYLAGPKPIGPYKQAKRRRLGHTSYPLDAER